MDPSDISLSQEARAERTLSKEQQDFLQEVAARQTAPEKIDFALRFMRQCISQEGAPRFRDFWFARKEVMSLFKQEVDVAIRYRLWEELILLTTEVRRLKEVLEEQSIFAIEQIELALQSIERTFARLEEQVEKVDVSHVSLHKMLLKKEDLYLGKQRKLQVLNALAVQLTSLRKEVIQTDMRVRFKSKLLQRLSEISDHVFPQRKEYMESLSALFSEDVESFVARNFDQDKPQALPSHVLRQDIKSLQELSKTLSLTSPVFHRTRIRLSECWDRLRALDQQERSPEELEKAEKVLAEVRESLSELEASLEELTVASFDQKVIEIQKKMREAPLERSIVQQLKEQIKALRVPLVQKQEQKAQELADLEKEKAAKKQEQLTALKNEITFLLEQGAHLELELFAERFDECTKTIEKMGFGKIEKQQWMRQLRPLSDLFAEKKEQALLSLSDDDRRTLETLREILTQKKKRRHDVKNQMEGYRKSLAKSGLDFEKAMLCQELLDQEKDSLVKIDEGIAEIEEKIASLEG